MTEHLLPISKTNVVTLICPEAAYGVQPVTPSVYKQLAYNASSLARQQTLTPNPELRGSRMQGALVVGPKNPGGPVQGYMTDQDIVMFYEATFGHRVTTEVGAAGCTLTTANGAVGTCPDAGAHSYVVVLTKTTPAGHTLHSALNAIAATITADGTHKVTVTLVGGPLPTGWTWALYRTKVGGDPTLVTSYFAVTPAATLAANVSSYTDDQPDASLGVGTCPATSTAGDYQHVITIGQTLPSYTIERSLPYLLDSPQYVLGVGSKVDTGKVQFKSTGYFDFQTAWLTQSVKTYASSAETGTAIDWRHGEKLHQAMIGAGKVMVGASLSGVGGLAAFGKFLDCTIDQNNNLDKTDYPLGLEGDRGSLTELQSISGFSGTLKVTDPTVLAFVQSAPALQLVQIEHDLATFGHKMIHQFYGVQIDPTDAAVSGQGILIIPFVGHAIQDPTSNLQVQVTIVNSEPDSSYAGQS